MSMPRSCHFIDYDASLNRTLLDKSGTTLCTTKHLHIGIESSIDECTCVSIFPELPISNIQNTLMAMTIDDCKIPEVQALGWGFPVFLDHRLGRLGCLGRLG
jgi:hypothetical protein